LQFADNGIGGGGDGGAGEGTAAGLGSGQRGLEFLPKLWVPFIMLPIPAAQAAVALLGQQLT
jgi:hypothetical protein